MEFYKKVLLSSILIVIVLTGILVFAAISIAPIFTFTETVPTGNTISINDTSEGGISGAIANASNGDIILLDSGNYTGANNTGININKSIKLKGNGPADTVIIDGQGFTRIFETDNNLYVTFTNITFINAKASGNGGAINNPNSNTRINFTNCVFDNNKIVNTTTNNGLGGAIYNEGIVSGLDNCNFTNISATSDGGAIYNDGVVAGLVDCDFTNINAGANGGAIYNGGLVAGLTECDFTNISASVDGGAIYNNDIIVGLTTSNFTNISAGANGGAIYNGGLVVGLTECNFTNISASVDGVVIYNNDIIVGLTACNFTNISTIDNNSVIFDNGLIVGLTDCNFINMPVSNNETISNNVNVKGSDSTSISIIKTNN